MNKQKVSTVDGREVKFFDTRKEAREYNRKNGTVGIGDQWYGWLSLHKYKIIKEDRNKRWFVFLDTKKDKFYFPRVNGKVVVFFATRKEARLHCYETFKKGVKDVRLYLPADVVGNTNNYRWFVFL